MTASRAMTGKRRLIATRQLAYLSVAFFDRWSMEAMVLQCTAVLRGYSLRVICTVVSLPYAHIMASRHGSHGIGIMTRQPSLRDTRWRQNIVTAC